MTIDQRLAAATRLIVAHRDVLDARPADGDVPGALVARGWDAPLLALDDDALVAIEERGVGAPWPRELATFVAEVRAVSALPELCTAANGSGGSTNPSNANNGQAPRAHEKARKRAQIDAFADALAPLLPRAARVIDVGSGHGHLTRAIAARVAVPVIGLERSPALAARARELAGAARATFATVDALADTTHTRFAADDVVVALHACGELSDAIVARAAASDAAGVVIVGCCLQKRRAAARAPLALALGELAAGFDAPTLSAALTLPRALLGLSNLTPRAVGVEASRGENVAARERRTALRLLLAEATGAPFPAGAEIAGLNRRAAHAPLATLVARAFALRGFALPAPEGVEAAAARAAIVHARARRLALPRTALARALEVYVSLDRAAHLAAHGFRAEVGTLFPEQASARNVAIRASRA